MWAAVHKEVDDLESQLRLQDHAVPSQKLRIDDMPQSLLCLCLTFLHGFSIAGQPPATCRRLANACGLERLCAHVLERDFAQEVDMPMPQQPHRLRLANVNSMLEAAAVSQRQRLQFQSVLALNFVEESSSSIPSVQELRALAQTLCGKGVLHVANVAAHQGRPSLLLWAAQRASLSNIDGEGRSVLMIAASRNRPVSVRAAFTCCDLEQQHNKFGAAMHMAAYSGAAAAVQELCNCRANLEATNGSFRQTPLHVACSRNHAEVVRILLRAGADATARDKDGATAMNICTIMGSSQAATALAQALIEE
eukprot:gnl/MRDRNA2_/MRDRNA2_77989_c0_seq1.p1 gnl/MRDRNA2_/MRDRNA2_77989_c0~~gnl/MRDRNA2_/MRDRNA2_77989_c0_seq1.p1  ORF type:complete len:344 (+),score=57.51 gnl/MRDRNA2_/MRDRNA2_77989_c0_seq1:110-1033(+)